MSKTRKGLHKQFIVMVLAVMVLLSFGSMKAEAASTVTAAPTSQSINFYPDGDGDDFYPVLMPLYQINQNNYAKLRDVADVIDFAVQWNAGSSVIEVITNQPFDGVQSTVGQAAISSKAAILSNQPIYVDGKLVSNLTMYAIDGNNYIKLRDLATVIDFGCTYNAINNSISLCATHGYSLNNVWGKRKVIHNITPEPTPNIIKTEQEAINDEDEERKNFADEVLRLVNEERAQGGLPALGIDSKLTAAAQVRAEELEKKFAHERPDGSSCFTVLKEIGVPYKTAGENLYMGTGSSVDTPQKAVQGWMNSPGHRANILKDSFTTLGVGYIKINNTVYWSQMFIG